MNELTIMVMRIGLAVVLSGLIGLEREIRDHPAGLRTHLLVGTGSCLLMLLSLYGFDDYLGKAQSIDVSRIPSYVISGLGFLGAGTIIVNGSSVKGLTTAASIWVMAAIGLVVGAGMYALSIITTVIVLISLTLLKRINKWIDIKQGDNE